MYPVVNYKYTKPGPAGPLKGRVVWNGKGVTRGEMPRKGDSIFMAFGDAVVTSVSRPKTGSQTQVS